MGPLRLADSCELARFIIISRYRRSTGRGSDLNPIDPADLEATKAKIKANVAAMAESVERSRVALRDAARAVARANQRLAKVEESLPKRADAVDPLRLPPTSQ